MPVRNDRFGVIFPDVERTPTLRGRQLFHRMGNYCRRFFVVEAVSQKCKFSALWFSDIGGNIFGLRLSD